MSGVGARAVRHVGCPGRAMSPRGRLKSGVVAVVLLGLLVTPVRAWAQRSVQDGVAALRAGRYQAAISIFQALATSPAATPAARRGWVRSLLAVGRYADAESAARAGASASPELLNTLGEVLAMRGDREAAERAFRHAIQQAASDSLVAELNLAVSQYRRGKRDAAYRVFDRFIDVYNSGRRLSPAELTAVGTAVSYLGERDPQLFKDALRAYDEAAAADSADLEPRLLAGELFLAKYNADDAGHEIRGVLAVNPREPRALVDLARVLEFDGRPGAADMARRALETNPSLVSAHVLLARLALQGEDYDGAQREAQQALDVNATSQAALSVLGAILYLRGDSVDFEAVARRAAALNPRDAGFYTTVADMAVQNRRYGGAVELARQALALDPTSSRALGILGINELRLGQIDSGRVRLEAAFKGDPYNVWYKNTLDLLDTFKDYREVRTAHFDLVLRDDEADVLAPYAGALAERAYTALAARYGYRPATPIRVEIFPRHADFSVRTVGLVGLGALGVTFGHVITMDSPAARERGDFNWGSTLWHEIAHVFHLGMTHQRVPRWFTEGLAVYEQRRARPGWGFAPDAGFLQAYQQGRLPPVSRLNDGFVRPRYPEEVGYAYYEASLVAEMIEQQHGFHAILGMLHAYARGADDAAAFRQVLGTDLKSFDGQFDVYVRRRFAAPLATLGRGDGFEAELQEGARLLKQGDGAGAEAHLRRALEIFPEYGGPGNAYAMLARIHEQRGERKQAADDLAHLTSLDESDYDALLQLASLRLELADSAGAAAALGDAIDVYPYDPALHVRLAQLATQLGNKQDAVRERRVVVALAPVDRAEALYQLALALYQAGDTTAAHREVLRSLEVAPNFDKAQQLLLELRSHSGGGAPPPRVRGAGAAAGAAPDGSMAASYQLGVNYSVYGMTH
jgi:tetratricopeptide (TPR) repeat protein